MSVSTREINEVSTRNGNTLQKTTQVSDVAEPSRNYPEILADRVIWFVALVIGVLLAFRFILALFGANSSNGFANFIYSASHPLVAPFFSLFSYHEHIDGLSRFEGFTLVALAVYLVIAWLLTKLVNLGKY
jgi:hypothetical protein